MAATSLIARAAILVYQKGSRHAPGAARPSVQVLVIGC